LSLKAVSVRCAAVKPTAMTVKQRQDPEDQDERNSMLPPIPSKESRRDADDQIRPGLRRRSHTHSQQGRHRGLAEPFLVPIGSTSPSSVPK
jgi:hypothetical protein